MPDMGENVHIEVDGDTLTITVDLSQKHGLSKSLKTHKIASTGGSQKIPGVPGVLLGLNVNRKVDEVE